MPTHEVENQPPPLADWNPFDQDRALGEALGREGAGWAQERVRSFAAFAGSAQAQRCAVEANESPPRLRTHDRYGHRVDEVDFHPAWHELMRAAVSAGVHALPWQEPRPGAHVARA